VFTKTTDVKNIDLQIKKHKKTLKTVFIQVRKTVNTNQKSQYYCYKTLALFRKRTLNAICP